MRTLIPEIQQALRCEDFKTLDVLISEGVFQPVDRITYTSNLGFHVVYPFKSDDDFYAFKRSMKGHLPQWIENSSTPDTFAAKIIQITGYLKFLMKSGRIKAFLNEAAKRLPPVKN